MPDAGGLLRRAVLTGVRRGGGGLPDVELTVRGVVTDAERLRRYDQVCGFRLTDALPPTYPHVLAFPLALELMARPGFPLPLVGLVHVANTIEVLRPVDRAESLDFTVRAENLRTHERGQAFDLLATATVDGSVVWRGRSEYLRRTSSPKAGRAREEAPTPAAVWRIGTDVGHRYADVSGDRNPIHTSTLAARLFGFPRRIAHGMWSKARCLAFFEGRLPGAYTVDVSFRAPVLLPSSVGFSATPTADGWTFALHSRRPHLTGSVRRQARSR